MSKQYLITESTKKRFEGRISAEPNTGCWLWCGGISGQRYGMLNVCGVMVYAHRVSWEIYHGSIPKGLFVLHKCDIPSCVNPFHLFLGTQLDNICDAVKKGRRKDYPHPKGILNTKHKLTEQQVYEIRDDTRQQRVIARDYGIAHSTVGRIKQIFTWKHLP